MQTDKSKLTMRLRYQPFGLVDQVITGDENCREMMDILISNKVWFDIDFIELDDSDPFACFNGLKY